jgi:hypothetical protein
MDGVRRRFDGGADVAQTALPLVAHPPVESADQFDVDDGRNYAKRVFVVVDQRDHSKVRRVATLP